MTKYDQSFKAEAVRLALTSTQPLSKTARDLGINLSSLYSWVSKAKDQSPEASDDAGNQTILLMS